MARKTAAEIEKLFAESGGAVGNEVTNAANTINRVTSGLANSGQKFDTTPQPQATPAAAGTVGTAVGTVGTVGTGAKPAATAPVSQFDVLTDFSKGLDKTATDMKRVKPSGNDLSANAVYIDQTAKDADKAYGDYVKASRDIGRAQTYNVQHQKNLQKIAADDGAQIDKNGNLVFQTEAGLKAYQSEMESYRKSSAATEGGASRLRDSATSYQSNVGKMNDMIVTSKRVAAQTRSTEEIESDISRLRFSGVAADDPNMIRLQTELRNRMYLGDDSLTQTSSGYYTDRATAAIQSGDYDAALRWANRMVSAPLTLEERQKATDWLNTVKGMSDTELNPNNGAIGGEFLVDTYDRDPGQFIDLIYDDYGRKYVDAVARQYGINPPKGAANYSDYAQYIEEVRNAIATDVAVNASGQSETDFQRYSIDKLNGSIDGLKQRNADAYFNQKIKDSVNAIEQRGGSLAYDYHAYENAQRAYTTLAYLQGALHTNEGGDYTGGGEKDLKKFQIQPMLDELKKYGFDIDLSAANYMTAINEAADLASRRAQQYRSELESRSATEGYSINVYDLGLYLHNAQSAEIGKIIDTAYADYLARNRKDLRDMSYIDLTIRLGDRILANSILSAAAQFAGAGIVTGVNNLLVTYGADGNDNLASYRPIMSGTIVSNPATALRSKTSETISKAYGSLAGSLYDGVMSSVDSTLGALGMGVAYTPVMGLSSAGDKIVEVLDDGGSAQQAFAMGVASALIESGTEYVSLDLLVKGFHETNLVKKLTNILIQGGVEASEEAVGEVLDQMADWYIMGSASAKSKEIEDLMDRGMSYSEAMKKVGYGSAMDILKSAAVGAFSGVLGSGGSGIGTTVMQTVNVSTFASNAADEVFRSRNYDPAGYDLYCKMAGVYSDDSDAVVQRKLKAFFSAVADAKNDAIRAEENAIVRSESKEQEQTAARAEAVEAQASADGEKVTAVRSAAVQKYIDSGKMNYATAQKAGAVLDRIYIGELTAENISSNDIDALNLIHPYAAAIASEVLGIEIKPASSKSEARRTFKDAIRNFAQTKVATVQAESVAVDEAKSEMFDTSAESAAQAQNRPTGNYVTTRTVPTVRRVIPRASAVQTAQTVEADPAPVAQTAPTQAAQPVQTAEAQTAEVAQSSGTPMTYRQWLAANANNRRIKKMSSEEKTSEYVKYRDSFGGSNTETGTMSRTQFAESYRAENPGASEVETDIAYQNYRQDNGLEAKPEQTTGIVQNEYSQRLNADTVDSVDALLRLFGLKGRFDDLGDANGYYDVKTGEVVLDIAPIEANSSNAFLFAVSHELGHAIRDRIGRTAWNIFQRYAIAAMGGEAAVKAKQSSNEVYSNVVDAREDVACDFIGRLLSDKDTLNAFTEAIRKGEIQPEHASKIASVFRSVIGKLTGKGSKQNAATAALVDKVRKDFRVSVEQAENVVRELQKAAAAAKNTQQRVIPRAEGVRNSMKAPTEQNAGSPFPTVNIDGQKVRPNKLYSMKSFADGTGFSLRQDENGIYRILSDSTGKVIDKVTPSMITDSNVSGVDAYDLLPYKPTADNDPVHRRFLPEDASESRGIKTRAESEMKLGEASIVPKSLNDSRKVKATIDSVTSDWATEAQADAITQMSKKEKSLAASKRAIEVKASVEAKQNVFKANLDKNGNRKYSTKPSDTAAQTEASTREERKAAREEASQRVMRKREGTDLLSVMKPNAKPSMKDAVDRYGAIPEGERPVREIKVPRRVEPNTKVRQTVRTALESAITPDSIVPSIEQDVINGMFNYTPDTNKAQMERANEWISNKSIEAARDEWFKSISSGKRSVDLIARGVLLYNEYATASNDTSLGEKERKVNRETATRILADMAAAATEAAQQTQMIRLLKKQTPDMQLYALQRSIQKLQDQLNERYKKKSAPQIVLNQELAERWMTALRSKDMELAHDVEVALYEDIARQIPKTFMDIMNAWRYLGMLGNGKTIIRNTIGNLMMTPMVTAKNRLGAVGEAIAQKTGRLSKSSRTKYNGVLTATKEGRNMLKFAEEDYLEFDTQDMLDGGTGKYNDSIGTKLDRAIRDAHSQFNAPGLKQWQQATNWLMNEAPGISDKAFMKHHYKAAFAQAAMARGFTASDFRDGRVKPEQLDSLRAYAVHQAQKATYHDSNVVSRALQGLRYKGDSRAGKIANVAIEGVIPFKGTPANVLMRSLEYSPLGLAKALTYDAWQSLKSKKVPVSTWLENLSSGLTGSALVALGYFMSSIGLLRVNADDDDKREGRQAYSIEVGGMSFSIDWLAPFAVPLFVGAEVNEYDSNGESLGSAIMDATSRLTAPILEMSMLSGVKDLLDTMTYAENGADVAQIVYSFFFLPFLNYASQFIPTAVSQVANSLEDNKTTTYVGDVSSQFDRNLIRNLAKITEKIPYVDAWQIDYVDNWGNKQENGAWYERLFNNFLNPAYTSSINVTDADSEIRRLKEIFGSDASGIEPDRRGYKIKVGEGDNRKDVTLNGEQYEKYQTAFGQQYALMVTALMASEVYDTLSDAEKLKAFEDIRTLANEYGKVAADVRYKVGDSGSNKLYDLMNAGIPISEAYAAKLMNTYLNSDTNADLTAKDKYEMFQLWLSDKDVWTSEQKSLVAEKYGKFYSMVAVGSKNFDEMQASGVSAEKSRAVSDAIGNIEPIGDNEQATQLQKMQAIVSVEGLSPKEQDAALRAYLDSSALQKYDACSTAGVTAKQYVSVYSKIDGVTPREGTKSAAVDQKLQIVVSTVSSERGQDAMFRNFLDNDAVPKYEAARAAGVSPKVFADFYSAKYTYGNANGSWSKSELVAWIKELGLSDSQADAIMKAANKNWSW